MGKVLSKQAVGRGSVWEGRFRPEPEVIERATRRRFTGEYKERIVREAAAWQKVKDNCGSAGAPTG